MRFKILYRLDIRFIYCLIKTLWLSSNLAYIWNFYSHNSNQFSSILLIGIFSTIFKILNMSS